MSYVDIRALLLILASLLLIGGCVSQSGVNNLSLKGNQLRVAVRLDQPVHKGQALYPYGLYRLVNAKSMAHQRYYRGVGLIRTADLGARDNYLVESRYVAKAQPEHGVVNFELPVLSGDSNCYAVVSMGSFAMPYARSRNPAQAYFIDLSEYHKNNDLLSKAKKSSDFLTQKKSERSALLIKIDEVRRTIGNNRAYQKGACVLPDMYPLPARPADAYSYDEAENIAMQAVMQQLAVKIGCQAIYSIKDRSLMRFISQFKCSDRSYLKYIPYTQSSIVFDVLEVVLLNCKKENEQSCFVVYATSVLLRALHSKEEILNKLHQPYLQWQRQVEQIRAEPRLTYNACTSDSYYLVEQNSLISASNQQVVVAERELKLVDAEVNKRLNLTGSALQCRDDARQYLNTVSASLMFVGPR